MRRAQPDKLRSNSGLCRSNALLNAHMAPVATPATGSRANTEDSRQPLRQRRNIFTRFGTIKAAAAHKQSRPSRWLLRLLSANCGLSKPSRGDGRGTGSPVSSSQAGESAGSRCIRWGISLTGLVTEFLPADAGLVHQTALGDGEGGHAFVVISCSICIVLAATGRG